MRKTYMSLAVSRALASEYPVGDPFGGAAYGEREMPLAAVAVAAFSGYTIATVGIAAMNAFQIITAVGAITAGIGAVTGNQDLMTIGSVMGLAGGIGSFASGSGLFGASEAASEFAGVTDADLAMEVAGEASGIEAVGAAVPTGDAGIINTPNQADLAMDVADETWGVNQQVSGGVHDDEAFGAITGSPQQSSTAGVMDMVKPQVGGDVTGFTGANEKDYGMELGNINAETGKTPGGWLDIIKNLGKNFNSFSKDNPVIAYSMMQGASNMVGGFFDTMKPAQKDLLEAQAEGLRANTAMTQQQLANIQAPLPRAVTGSPYAGLINSAVTGRV